MSATDASRHLVRIDAHHHLWRYEPEEFGWLTDELCCLRRDWLAPELLKEMASVNVAGAVAVQARQSEAETDWLLRVAEQHEQIKGVVGWLPIADPAFGAALEHWAGQPKFKGLRHVVQAEQAGFLEGAEFNRGVSTLNGKGLVFDLLIREHQLPEAIRFVDRHPRQTFVLDHLAKPRIGVEELEPWRSRLRELAERSNVACKISGMVTESGSCWTADLLKPYFDIALEAFTPRRLMIGTDWPVLTAHCTYRQWWQIAEAWTQPLSVGEQADILGRTAARAYRLDATASW